MKKIISTVTLLSLVGCSSIYQRPESIKEKMSRYRSKEVRTNIVPDYFANEFSFKGRIPASAADNLDYNNKTLYFLTLYKQYDQFTEVYPEYKKRVQYCPRFHQQVLEYDSADKKHSFTKKDTIDQSEDFVANLERGHKDFSSAIKDHMNRNHDEIVQLCEQGFSHNYYIYENLVTLSKEPGVILRNKESYNTLLKSPIFFNEKLLSAVATKNRLRKKSRGIASSSSLEHESFIYEASNRVGASWFKYYLNK